MTLWPSPVQAESMQHRFRLIDRVVAHCREHAAADPAQAALLGEIADLAREALDTLRSGLRTIG
jgi:hypothetical protein